MTELLGKKQPILRCLPEEDIQAEIDKTAFFCYDGQWKGLERSLIVKENIDRQENFI